MTWRDPCQISECGNIVGRKGARGFCNKHYLRWWSTGDPLGSKRPAPEDRFWPRVEVTGFCWNWTGTKDQCGYGMFGFQKRTVRAHRWAYEYLVAPILQGLELDHLCRNPSCVNPDHLEPVSREENLWRGLGCRVRNGTVNHCPQGHEYTTDNTYTTKDGNKTCRICRADSRRRHELKKKEKIACPTTSS